MPDPALAGEPFHCCLCGRYDVRCLCRDCRLAHSVDGVMPLWLVALKNEASRQSEHLRYWQGRRSVQSLDALGYELAG